jgi:hypothetical protein
LSAVLRHGGLVLSRQCNPLRRAMQRPDAAGAVDTSNHDWLDGTGEAVGYHGDAFDVEITDYD